VQARHDTAMMEARENFIVSSKMNKYDGSSMSKVERFLVSAVSGLLFKIVG
jgi:hypothetical protein